MSRKNSAYAETGFCGSLGSRCLDDFLLRFGAGSSEDRGRLSTLVDIGCVPISGFTYPLLVLWAMVPPGTGGQLVSFMFV